MRYSSLKIIIPALVLLPVIWQNFFSIQPIVVTSNFHNRSPWFDYLLPAGRVQRTGNGVAIQAEPVYFDLRLPLRLQGLQLNFKFSGSTDRIRIGIQNAPGWNYYFPKQINAGHEIVLLTNDFAYTVNYRQRFIIAIENMAAGEVELLGVKATMTRHEFYWQWIYDKTINRYKLWISKLLAPLAKNTRPFTEVE